VEKIIIGAGVVSIWIRHSKSLKDRRQITQSLVQKLKNEGFSASEVSRGENFKRAMVAFSICSGGAGFVTEQLEKAKRFFMGDFEVVHAKTEMMEMDTGFELPFLEPEE
jgi:uncharacterized protein YlxP (DUF503 family)